jgi:hypothetical protein
MHGKNYLKHFATWTFLNADENYVGDVICLSCDGIHHLKM